MITRLITVGDSKGIQIPDALIEQYNLTNASVQLLAKEDGILILPVKKSRLNWEDQFKKEMKNAHEQQDDNMDAENIFDETEWTW